MTSSVGDEALLRAALRTRPHDPVRLANLVHLTPEQTADGLARLDSRRLLDFDGERIGYRSPADSTAELILGMLHEQLDSTRELLDTVGSLTEQLSESLRWVASDSLTEDSIPIRVYRGTQAAFEAVQSMITAASSNEGELLGALPQAGPEDEELRVGRQRWHEMPSIARRIRLIVPPDACPEDASEIPPGLEARVLLRPPSWFWVDPAGGEVALPLAWGDSSPTTTLVLTHRSASALAVNLFETLWDRSGPCTAQEAEPLWLPLMRLMREGLTIDGAAEHLGINPRTARRRLAVGMDHYGVGTIFGLAAAWGADLAGGTVPEFPRPARRPG